MPEQPNVIVIVSDTFRPDHLGVNGHPRVKTPELDAFILRGVTFDGARVSSFPTIPMRTDWFTGRFSWHRHGWQDLDRREITLAHLLRGAGYTTQLIADTTHLLRGKFWEPFDHFHFERGHEGDAPFSRINDPIQQLVSDRRKVRVYKKREDTLAMSDVHAHTNFRRRYESENHIARLVDGACQWTEDNYRGGPFFLWLDCFDVHEPWFPPEYLWRMYDPDYQGEPMVHPNYHSAEFYSESELRNLQSRYAAMCTLVSKHLGRMFRLIEDCRLLENSVVCFMSDHGMYLGERGRAGKSLITLEENDTFPFHAELARICWTMHFPPDLGLKTAAAGQRFTQTIQAPDLLPTMLDLCGIDPPGEAPIEGRSLVPLLRGDTTEAPRDIAVTTQTQHRQRHPEFGPIHCRRPTVTDGEWTLLISEPPKPAPPKLYHVAVDPLEQQDVVTEYREEARRLHRRLLEWLKEHDVPQETRDRLAAEQVGLG